MKKYVLTAVLVIAVGATAFKASAQCGADYKWPEDGDKKSKAEESLVLLKDNRSSNPKHAIPPLNWLITNTPDLNKSLYIYGADVYEALARTEKDAAKKAKYVDSLLIIHDLRITNTECGEKASITNRKALAAYPYLLNTEKVKNLLIMMNQTFELNGNDVMDGTLIPFMQTIYMVKVKYKGLTDDEVIEKYDMVTDIIEQKIKKAQSEGKPVDKYKKYSEDVDKIFESMEIPFDCAKVRARLEPKYNANPNDIDLAKKIFYSMLRGKCTDDPLWLKTAEQVYKETPDFGIAKNLAIKYLAQESYAKAEEWFKKALSIAPTSGDKAEMIMYLAKIEAKNGSKVAARDYCRQALSADPGLKEAYELIGDLYMNSFKDCSKEKSYAEDRLVYIAAYDMYARSGNQQKMGQAKSQFPSTTEIFEVGWKEGESKKIDWCWVGETITIRTRGKD
jgi:tetratricopeptide (TPR) repeat protein